MPKIKRTRKLVITEKQAAGSRKEEDIVGQGNVDEGKSLLALLAVDLDLVGHSVASPLQMYG